MAKAKAPAKKPTKSKAPSVDRQFTVHASFEIPLSKWHTEDAETLIRSKLIRQNWVLDSKKEEIVFADGMTVKVSTIDFESKMESEE